MGNRASVRREKRAPTICRIVGYYPDEAPEVDTMGLPFDVCKQIFIRLTIRDISHCMLVCKEWRSLIDTCRFWKAYMNYHFDFSRRGPRENSFMFWWKATPSCLRTPVSSEFVPAENIYVFKPFPAQWRCGFVVPYAMQPPEGSVVVYHHFMRCLLWLTLVRVKVKEYGLTNQLEVCIFQWMRQRMPSGQDVLDIFNAHEHLVKTSCATRVLNRGELSRIYPLLNTSNYQGQIFDGDFFSWFVQHCGDTSMVFQCSQEDVTPTPAFILTQIAPGWIGGLIYAL